MEEKLSVLKDFIDSMLFQVKERIINGTRTYADNPREEILDGIKMDLYLLDEIERYVLDEDSIYNWYENYYEED